MSCARFPTSSASPGRSCDLGVVLKEPARDRADRAGLHRELPAGSGDLLPEAAAQLLLLRRQLLGAMDRWGYQPVIPPLMEYAEVFSRALPDPSHDVSAYRLVDRSTGHVLAMRPDFTPQIARMVSSRFGAAHLPLRLCYEGPVLRHVPAQKGHSRELHQLGAELLGVVDPEADAEAIALTVACLMEVGVEGFKVDVGQVEFFRGVLSDCDLTPEQAEGLTRCVARKDVSDLERTLVDLPLSDRKKELLAELPLLAGDTSVLDRAAALVESDHSRRALDNLAQVVGYVATHGLSEHLTVDLGELRGIDYHTGVIFEAFVHQLGTALCRGGRYDHLLGLYGQDLPATGFSLDLLAVIEALHLQQRGQLPARRGAFIINFSPDRTPALGLARRLREVGVRAARDLIRRPLEDSLAHAREQNFRWAAILGTPECLDRTGVLVDLESGSRATYNIDQLAQRAAEEQTKCPT